jgi:acyl-homoserine lactone acylase PvdQ
MPNDASEPQLADVNGTGMLGLLSSYCWSTAPDRRWKRLISPHGVRQSPKSAVSLSDARSKPSIPVPFTSANWGSLASFGMTAKQTTKRIYGDRGNSFVAAVEFGPKVRAKSILAGGQSSDPRSPHFNDQAAMYARGEFKDVLFYKDDIERNLERKYHPGK